MSGLCKRLLYDGDVAMRATHVRSGRVNENACARACVLHSAVNMVGAMEKTVSRRAAAG